MFGEGVVHSSRTATWQNIAIGCRKKSEPHSKSQKEPSGMLAALRAGAATLGSGMCQRWPFLTANLAKNLANGTNMVIFQTVQ